MLSDTVLSMDVYSQAVVPDRTEYLNDSFCVQDEEEEDDSIEDIGNCGILYNIRIVSYD